MDLRDRHRVLLMSGGGLPPGYHRADYLQAQGDRAVIDTGVPGNNDTLRFDFTFNVDRFTSYRGYFTNYSSESANCWRLSEGTSATHFLYTLNSKTSSSGSVNNLTYIGSKTRVVMDKTSIQITAGGNTATGATLTAVGTENSGTIYINSSRRYAQTRDDVIKWYNFRIWNGATLIRDYIPCVRLSDSTAGFYDLANNTFNPSIGSVDFIAGHDF